MTFAIDDSTVGSSENGGVDMSSIDSNSWYGIGKTTECIRHSERCRISSFFKVD